MTYTVATLQVSEATYNEIRTRLDAVGYTHVLSDDAINMHGLRLQRVSDEPLTFTSGSDLETLGQLFLQGPTWDGNLVSKSGRDSLLVAGLADAADGWQWLTARGVRAALQVNVSQWADQRWYKKQSGQ